MSGARTLCEQAMSLEAKILPVLEVLLSLKGDLCWSIMVVILKLYSPVETSFPSFLSILIAL